MQNDFKSENFLKFKTVFMKFYEIVTNLKHTRINPNVSGLWHEYSCNDDTR